METEKIGVMSLNLAERRLVAAEWAKRYQACAKSGKGRILDEYCHLTGLTRKHASSLLSVHGRKIRIIEGGKLIVLEADAQKRKRRPRSKDYDPSEYLEPLRVLWELSGNLCSRRLCAFMSRLDPKQVTLANGAIKPEVFERLRKISPATVDRLLSPERIRLNLYGRSCTRSGGTILTRVPVIPYYHQDFKQPGNLQVDLVSHDGGNSRGEYCFTLTLTDPATTWTVCKILLNKAHLWVVRAMEEALAEYPFEIRQIHSDSGSEFVNWALHKWCKRRGIRLTRSRPNRKNDNCYVEQKNDDVVRKTVGYHRYEGFAVQKMLTELYEVTNWIRNYHTPSMKLKEKIRIGSKVRRVYDLPLTPVERVLAWEDLTSTARATLTSKRDAFGILEMRKRQAEIATALLNLQKPRQNGLLQVKTSEKKTYRLSRILLRQRGEPSS